MTDDKDFHDPLHQPPQPEDMPALPEQSQGQPPAQPLEQPQKQLQKQPFEQELVTPLSLDDDYGHAQKDYHDRAAYHTAGHDKGESEPVDQEIIELLLDNVRGYVTGNSYAPDKISIGSFQGEILHIPALQILEFLTETSDKQINGKAHGELVGSRQDLQVKVRAHIERISRDREIHAQAVSLLRKRQDLGIFQDNLILPLDKFNKQYVLHEKCNMCETRGQIRCQACQGKRQIACHHCHATREIQCTQCRGRQFMETGQGRNQCTLCQGRGRIGCRFCQQSGHIKCHTCRGTGQAACNYCGTTGWHSLVTSLRIKAKTHFGYDSDNIPEEAAQLIEIYKARLAMDKHADITIIDDIAQLEAASQMVKENEFAVPYHIRLPWGDMVLDFGGKPVKGVLFGFNALFLNTPPYLEKICAKPIRAIEQAVRNRGDAGRAIIYALQYRLIADIYMIAGRMPQKKAFHVIKERYPSGLPDDTLKNLIMNVGRSLQHLTDKSQQKGVMIGAGGSFAVFLIYFSVIRPIVTESLPREVLSVIFDVAILAASITAGLYTIQYMAQKTIRQAFGRFKRDQKKIAVKLGHKAYWGIGAIALAFIVAVFLTVIAGSEPPFWWRITGQ